MNQYIVASVVLVGLVSHVHLLYDKESPVIQLDSKTFDKAVMNDDGLWLIEFYAPWCVHCQSLSPEYIKVAERFKGLVKVGSVDAVKEQELAARFQISGYPTLKLFGRDKNKPKDLQSARSADGIVEGVLKYIQDNTLSKKKIPKGGKPEKDGDQYILTTENFDSFLKSADKPVFVKFYAPWCGHCKKMAGEFKLAATDLKDIVYLAKVDATVETDLTQRYGVKGFPTLKIFANNKGKIDSKDYTGGRNREEINEWFRSNAQDLLPPPHVETVQVSNQKEFEKQCTSKIFCMIAFVPPLEDSSVKERLQMIKQLNEASVSTGGVGWGWVWIEGTSQDNLERVLNVDQMAYPILVGVHPGKKVYGVLKTTFKQKNIEVFVKAIKSGKEHFSSFKTIPALDETKPWDIPSDQKKSRDEL